MKKRITLILALLTATAALIGVSAATSAAASATMRGAARLPAATSVSGSTSRATRFSDPVFYLENKHTATICVDDSSRFGLRAIRCNSTDHQRWFMIYRGGINYAWKNVRTARCIDDSAQGLRAFACNGRDFQKWRVTPAGNGWFVLKNVHTRRCLEYRPHYGLRATGCIPVDYQQWL